MDLVIGLDADDTLWRNEEYFRHAESECTRLMTRWAHGDHVHQRLLDIERRNLGHFGYGAKGFVLSMIETAIELSDGEIPASDIQRIIGIGKLLLEHPIQLLPGVERAVRELADAHPLILVTKGDLLHQEAKIAASGLADHFWQVEIVSEKNPETYRRLLERHGVGAERFVMVGNSLSSDVLPVVAIGGRAVHVPYHLNWELELAAVEHDHTEQFDVIAALDELPILIESWETVR